MLLLLSHLGLTLFNLLGWIHPKTRKANLALLILTGLSWFGLGAFYGWGYCPLTDWHWDIKRQLGQTGLPASYIKYLFDTVTGFNGNRRVLNITAVVLYFAALAASACANFRGKKSQPFTGPPGGK